MPLNKQSFILLGILSIYLFIFTIQKLFKVGHINHYLMPKFSILYYYNVFFFNHTFFYLTIIIFCLQSVIKYQIPLSNTNNLHTLSLIPI